MAPGLVWSYEIDILKKVIRHEANSTRAEPKRLGYELSQPDAFAPACSPIFCRNSLHHLDFEITLNDEFLSRRFSRSISINRRASLISTTGIMRRQS
jgi:hypothetical protein